MGMLQLSIILLYTITFLFKSHLCLIQGDIKVILDGHNAARAEVGVGPISWDKEVEAFAQDFADKAKSDCTAKNVSKGSYGTNIQAGNGADATNFVMKLWVEEKSKYNYTSNSCVDGIEIHCSHYTQVVWRNSVRIGCGASTCGADQTGGWPIFVCAYAPPGNIPGERPY